MDERVGKWMGGWMTGWMGEWKIFYPFPGLESHT